MQAGRRVSTAPLDTPEALGAAIIVEEQQEAREEAERARLGLAISTDGSRTDSGAAGYAVDWENGGYQGPQGIQPGGLQCEVRGAGQGLGNGGVAAKQVRKSHDFCGCAGKWPGPGVEVCHTGQEVARRPGGRQKGCMRSMKEKKKKKKVLRCNGLVRPVLQLPPDRPRPGLLTDRTDYCQP